MNFEFNHFHNSLGGDAVEGGCLIADLSVEVCPELDEEEGVLGALAVQLLQPVRLFRELVLNLSHVYWLQNIYLFDHLYHFKERHILNVTHFRIISFEIGMDSVSIKA